MKITDMRVPSSIARDLKGHADYLEQLAEARVPVLWRPLHEVEGGWFWWTDAEMPENTAALWRFMFDYFTKERKLHNLIWLYAAALRCGKGQEGVTNSYIGLGKAQEDTYAKSFATMKQVAPGKMIALAECEAIPNPDKLAKDGPPWLYCLPWWGVGNKHTAEWAKTTCAHEHFVTFDQLPKWKAAK